MKKDPQSFCDFVIKIIKLTKEQSNDYPEFLRLIIHCNHNNFVDTHVLKKPGRVSSFQMPVERQRPITL